LEIAELLVGKGINCGVVDVHRLKPVDNEALLSTISSYPHVVTLEENSIVGGLGSIMGEIFIDNTISTPLMRLALPDVQCMKYGSREWLHEQFHFDTPSIIAAITEWVDIDKKRASRK
jgi:transketolase C-terminal domain/subunit